MVLLNYKMTFYVNLTNRVLINMKVGVLDKTRSTKMTIHLY